MQFQRLGLSAGFKTKCTISRSRLEDKASRLLRSTGVCCVRCLDRALRYCFRIREFSCHTECVLRVSKARARSSIILSDGSSVQRGEEILELHFWNERLSFCPYDGSLFEWALKLERYTRLSLMLLAEQMDIDDRIANIGAIHARLATRPRRSDRLLRDLGFTILPSTGSLRQITHDFFENFLIYGLIWAFHPGRSRNEIVVLNRVELWLSKADLRRIYGRARYASRGDNTRPHTLRMAALVHPCGRGSPPQELGKPLSHCFRPCRLR